MDLFCDNFLIIKSCDPTIYKSSLLSIKPYINDKVGLFFTLKFTLYTQLLETLTYKN